ncbi:antirestriction protein [Enterobacter sp. R4-368]|uniref:antirestriction protein n=1 Tax=Enterobacter sp. R4-368 TaxID=1166130 RepID=UPI00034F0545|nr:antirestriction protein [Enterobacter sp. R4-368]AGN88356.1 antirestriction protein [Enterobacter sp. R4-368]
MHTSTPDFQPARILDGYVKLRFLPALFGHDFICAENNVYNYAAQYLEGYDGGVWDYAVIPEGGGFMKPEGEERWHFSNSQNFADLTLSSEAAGIVITALVLNHRSWMYDRHDEEELCRLYCRRHHQLMAYAEYHPEAAAIFRALD